jgi:protein ImuA
MSDSPLVLAQLRQSLKRLEPRRCAEQAELFSLDHGAVDRALGGGLALGRMHEIFSEANEAGSCAGFAALLGLRAGTAFAGRGAGAVRGGKSAPLLWLRTEAAQKQGGRLHATGLGELGLDPAALLLGLVPDEPALLHAAAEATRCTGLGVLIVECWGPMRGFDLTASRRLMLAAEGSGVTVLVLRILTQLQFQPSAADTRWRVAAAPSTALEADAPGAPMFELELLRRRAGPPAGPWRVEWDRDRSSFQEPIDVTPARTPLSRPVLPMVARRATAADAA